MQINTKHGIDIEIQCWATKDNIDNKTFKRFNEGEKVTTNSAWTK